jgi:hypothetical protein
MCLWLAHQTTAPDGHKVFSPTCLSISIVHCAISSDSCHPETFIDDAPDSTSLFAKGQKRKREQATWGLSSLMRGGHQLLDANHFLVLLCVALSLKMKNMYIISDYSICLIRGQELVSVVERAETHLAVRILCSHMPCRRSGAARSIA